MEDIRNRRFTSSTQFLIGEKVKHLPTGSIYYIYRQYSEDSNRNIDRVYCMRSTGSSDYFDVTSLDLAIEDEQAYIAIKTARFAHLDAIAAYKLLEQSILNERHKVKFKPILDSVTEVFDQTWDYSIINDRLEVILHFPEILISNSRNKSHTIKDLYLKLVFKSDLKLDEMYGCRGTVNYLEYLSGYKHSHLNSSGRFHQWSNWCVGEADTSDFAYQQLMIRSEFNVNSLLRFLYQIPTYLSWESLEGGPYVKIETIGNREDVDNRIREDDIPNIYKDYLALNTSVPYKLTKHTNSYNFRVEQAELETILAKVVPNNYKCFKVGERYTVGRIDHTPIQELNQELSRQTIFTFRGVPVIPKVEPVAETFSGIQVAIPGLTQAIARKLETNLHTFSLIQ